MLLMTYGAEQRAAGKYAEKVEVIRSWNDDKEDLPAKKVAKMLHITIPQLEEVISLMQEHPDWDDSEIADNADWRRY